MSSDSLLNNVIRGGLRPWTEHDVAIRCGVSVHTVRKWRMNGGGPEYWKLAPGRGGAVRYDPGAVVAFLEAKTRLSTSD